MMRYRLETGHAVGTHLSDGVCLRANRRKCFTFRKHSVTGHIHTFTLSHTHTLTYYRIYLFLLYPPWTRILNLCVRRRAELSLSLSLTPAGSKDEPFTHSLFIYQVCYVSEEEGFVGMISASGFIDCDSMFLCWFVCYSCCQPMLKYMGW